jgi:hypothetical protein
MRRDKTKDPTAIHIPSGLRFLPLEKASVIANYLENQSYHRICVRKITNG